MLENADNNDVIFDYAGKECNVHLVGRTLWKDGSWNTLCLPFSLSDLNGTELAGATIKTLESANFINGTLTLNFSEDLTSIEAGKPYIVKWKGDGTDNIDGPTFQGVTISREVNDVTYTINDEMSIAFKGTYQPVRFGEEGDNSVLYLGADNTLYYPSGAMTINAQRAFFQLEGLTAGEVSGEKGIKAFVLNFGEEETGISMMEDGRGKMDDAWYSIDGRRLDGKPTAKGVYIWGGRKVMIK